ncbi:MAG: L-threonylcarbamoyladenylate synthase [Pseudomonadota bacterium]
MQILQQNDPSAAKIAAEILRNNGIICFATETVYALACDASSDIAVAALYKIKQRDLKKPIAVFVQDLKTAKEFLNFSQAEEAIAKKFMPGMISLVLQKKNLIQQKIKISSLLNNNDKNLALRIPDHQFCLELLNEFKGIIAATSANPSNQAAATDFEQAQKYFLNKIDLIIDGGVCLHKIASTVLKVEDGIKIIRSGLITKNQLELCIS